MRTGLGRVARCCGFLPVWEGERLVYLRSIDSLKLREWSRCCAKNCPRIHHGPAFF